MKLKRIVTAVLALALVLGGFRAGTITGGAAESKEEVVVTGTYGQTEAREMLAQINAFRTGDQAWYWNEDDTEQIYCTGLGNLTYDYALEQIAMQRAAELAVSYSHTRPDGTSCFTATYNGIKSSGENIAYGYNTADDVFTAWREDKDYHDGQGHRRNMLGVIEIDGKVYDRTFTAIGIGHIVVNGRHYWVQEFGYSISDTAETTANDSETSVSVTKIVTTEDEETTTPAPEETTTPAPEETTTPEPGETTTPAPEETATPEPGETTTPDVGPSLELTEDGTLTVSGEGSLGTIPESEKAQITSVVIEEGVTGIGEKAFEGCSSLKNITIPDSVTTIEANAFQGITATIHYSNSNASLTSEKRKELGKGASLAWAKGDYPLEMLDSVSISPAYELKAESNIFTIHCSGEKADLVNVMLDGKVVDKSNYTLEDGSTKLTFTKEFLDTLSAGEHDLKMSYYDDAAKTEGEIEVTLTIDGGATGPEETETPAPEEAQTPAPASTSAPANTAGQENNTTMTSPKTGGETNLWVWVVLLAAMSGGVLAGSKLMKNARR